MNTKNKCILLIVSAIMVVIIDNISCDLIGFHIPPFSLQIGIHVFALSIIFFIGLFVGDRTKFWTE